ncbi:MAG TPA: endonuclease/exonuclease/phosphatase family protein [Propionibacteriaceae bacterium]|nr:endonuclease/exonuclease/phosphatase family protein [Propionibacteriaceae bacterium]
MGEPLLRAVGVALTAVNGLLAVWLVALDAVPTLQPVARQLLVFLASAIPYTPVPVAGAALGLVLWLDGRVRLIGVGLLTGAVALASAPWWQVPTSSTPRPTADDLRVVSLNTEYGNADIGTVVRLSRSADVLAFQENTPEFVRHLEAAGLLVDFPYRQGTALRESYGTMFWSRTPLTVAAFGATAYTSLVVRTTVRGTPWTVSTLHAASPKDGGRVWARDAETIAGLLRPYVGEHLVVVGDFNAVDEHLTMRRIRDVGLADSMTGWPLAAGDGFQNSWPNDPRLPFLIRIDHALHSANVDAWRPSYTTVAGTDHRALTATFAPR